MTKSTIVQHKSDKDFIGFYRQKPMKKLTEDQLHQISHDVFYEIYPDYTEKDENDFKTNLLNTILTATLKFIQKYQEKIDE